MNKKLQIISLAIGLLSCIACRELKKEMFVTTGDVTKISANSAEASGAVIDLGEGATKLGHCYANTQFVTISNFRAETDVPSKPGTYTIQLTNLEPGTKYYYRAYISDGTSPVYGKEKSFTTLAIPAIVATDPSSNAVNVPLTKAVSATFNQPMDPSTITTSTFTLSQGVTVIPGAVSYTGTTATFTPTNNLVAGNTYTATITTTAKTPDGIGLAAKFSWAFSTTSPVAIPTLTTVPVTSIGLTTAVSGGNVTADGGGEVTTKGICWAITSSPTISNSITSDGSGTGSFVSNLSGLLPATTYYVRAYATNSAGTAYGNEVTFTTAAIVVPALTTTAATSITLTTAISGGNITSNGGSEVTTKGVCWATTPNPDISGTKTTDGTGSGIFISNLTGLSPGTTYHIRAYATNIVGTAYGDDLTFTTSVVVIPSISTTVVTSVGLTTAVSGGNITADGGGSVTARGVCWATTANPTTAGSKTSDATGTGSYISSLTGLQPGATYFVRAYASNSAGTAYGNQISFSTKIEDITGISYNTVIIGTQVWMAENLKTNRLNDNTAIPNVTDNTAWSALSTPGYCWYDNDETSYKSLYGALYNWFAVNTGKLCPTGWHVPGDAEWTTFTDYLTNNGFGYQGSGIDIAKSIASTIKWTTFSTAGTIGNDLPNNNRSGFNAFPAGYRIEYGAFFGIFLDSEWWSSSEYSSNMATCRYIEYNSSDVFINNNFKNIGFSVRCVRNY